MAQDICPVCGTEGSVPLLTAIDRFNANTTNFTYVRCLSCQLAYLSPLPASEEIASFYEDEYAPHTPVNKASIQKRHDRIVNRYLIKHRYDVRMQGASCIGRIIAPFLAPFAMHSTLRPHGQNRLLDVGCGNGGWLYRHRLLGWDAQGTDFSAHAVKAARKLGLTIYDGGIFEVPLSQRFDIISFRHVLEHVIDPVPVLVRARELLFPGGVVLLSVPNLESAGFARWGVNWYHLDPPRHILHFNRASLTCLSLRSGFVLNHFRTLAQPRTLFMGRIYKEVYGDDPASNREITWRRSCIQRSAELKRIRKQREKYYRKILGIASWWDAHSGRGEIIEAELVLPS